MWKKLTLGPRFGLKKSRSEGVVQHDGGMHNKKNEQMLRVVMSANAKYRVAKYSAFVRNPLCSQTYLT